VLLAAGVVAVAFAATPFLIPEIAADTGVRLGAAGLLSTFQVGGFAAATFVAGRLLRPQERLHRLALALMAIANGASALAPRYWMVLATQTVAGVAMGMLTWLSWSEAARHRRGVADVAAVGPLVAVAASPILGWMAHALSYRAVFASVAGVALLSLAARPVYGELPVIGRNVSDSRSNRLLLASLFILTTAGSAVFVFAAAAGRIVAGLPPAVVSIAFSLNALVGVVATRFGARSGTAGAWLLAAAPMALIVGVVASPAAYLLAMTAWGFAFWMGVPAVFQLLADRALSPAERVGDAQSLMALGRVFGPLLGGAILGADSFARLSYTGAAGLVAGAAVVIMVEWARRRLARRR
jgi:predicted MFS family arabinose efflux permease